LLDPTTLEFATAPTKPEIQPIPATFVSLDVSVDWVYDIQSLHMSIIWRADNDNAEPILWMEVKSPILPVVLLYSDRDSSRLAAP